MNTLVSIIFIGLLIFPNCSHGDCSSAQNTSSLFTPSSYPSGSSSPGKVIVSDSSFVRGYYVDGTRCLPVGTIGFRISPFDDFNAYGYRLAYISGDISPSDFFTSLPETFSLSPDGWLWINLFDEGRDPIFASFIITAVGRDGVLGIPSEEIRINAARSPYYDQDTIGCHSTNGRFLPFHFIAILFIFLHRIVRSRRSNVI